MDSAHEGIRNYINNTRKLIYSSNPSLANWSEPNYKTTKKDGQTGSEKSINSTNSNDTSSCNSNNNSINHQDDHNKAIIAMAQIKHNIDMGLKSPPTSVGMTIVPCTVD